MLQLQDQFRNTKKDASSIIEFCHTLVNVDDDIKDVDSPIIEIQMVMQILRQLPSSYHSIVDVITNTKPFPSFLEAKNMLLLHESREAAIDTIHDPSISQSSALYSSSNTTGKSKNHWTKTEIMEETLQKLVLMETLWNNNKLLLVNWEMH